MHGLSTHLKSTRQAINCLPKIDFCYIFVCGKKNPHMDVLYARKICEDNKGAKLNVILFYYHCWNVSF